MVELSVNMSQSKMFESPSTAPFDVYVSVAPELKHKRLDTYFNSLFQRQPTCRQSSLLLHYDNTLPSNLYPKSLKEVQYSTRNMFTYKNPKKSKVYG